VINACAKVGNSAAAEQWLTKMLDSGVRANVQSYSAVVSAFAKTGDIKGSEKWLTKMLEAGIRGDTICYTSLINGCARVGDIQKAEEWLVKMLEDGVEPNVITFNAVIAAAAKKGHGRRAENWLEKMKLAEVLPNSFSYNSAAKPFVALGDYKKVEQLMANLRSDGLAFDDFCLTSLLHAYGNAKPRQQQRAEAAFREFVAEKPKGVSSNTMAALGRVIGKSAADALCRQCGLDQDAIIATAKGGGKGKGGSRMAQ